MSVVTGEKPKESSSANKRADTHRERPLTDYLLDAAIVSARLMVRNAVLVKGPANRGRSRLLEAIEGHLKSGAIGGVKIDALTIDASIGVTPEEIAKDAKRIEYFRFQSDSPRPVILVDNINRWLNQEDHDALNESRLNVVGVLSRLVASESIGMVATSYARHELPIEAPGIYKAWPIIRTR
jgi:hypothetical protein